MPSPIRLKPLATLCRRLAVATDAGLEDRRIWRSEAERARGSEKAAIAEVSRSLDRGDAIGDALARAGKTFPPMFRQMVAVGDESGRLDRTYRRLAEHFEHLLAARRTLFGALAWPGLQLALAVLVVGVVIWISSSLNLRNVDGAPLDVFGFGLTGDRGLVVYSMIVTLALIAAMLCWQGVRRGMVSFRPLVNLAAKIPGLGDAVRTLALARLTWALQLVLDSDIDLRRAAPLALETSGLDAYRRTAPEIVAHISQGASLHDAMAAAGEFPRELLDAVSVGEQTGSLPETLARTSKEYQRQAEGAISLIARIIGGIVWLGVAALIITLIFRVYGGHISAIQKLSQPGGGL